MFQMPVRKSLQQNQSKGEEIYINFSFSKLGALTYSLCVKGFYFMYLNPKHPEQLLLKLGKSLTHLNGNIIKTLMCLEAVTSLLLTI